MKTSKAAAIIVNWVLRLGRYRLVSCGGLSFSARAEKESPKWVPALFTLFIAIILMYSFSPYVYFQTTMAQRRQPSEEMLQACKRGETGTVQKLISKGVDPSNKDHSTGKTPLHWASLYVYTIDSGYQAHSLVAKCATSRLLCPFL